MSYYTHHSSSDCSALHQNTCALQLHYIIIVYNCTFYHASHLSRTASNSSALHLTNAFLSMWLHMNSLVFCVRKAFSGRLRFWCFATLCIFYLTTSYCYCTSTPCEMRGPSNARFSKPSAIFPPPNISQNVDSTATPIGAWRHWPIGTFSQNVLNDGMHGFVIIGMPSYLWLSFCKYWKVLYIHIVISWTPSHLNCLVLSPNGTHCNWRQVCCTYMFWHHETNWFKKLTVLWVTGIISDTGTRSTKNFSLLCTDTTPGTCGTNHKANLLVSWEVSFNSQNPTIETNHGHSSWMKQQDLKHWQTPLWGPGMLDFPLAPGSNKSGATLLI